MRPLPLLMILAAVAAATPALALTVQPAPTRDQAPHLKQGAAGGGVDLRDTLAGGGRPFVGSTVPGATYSRTQTFSFGSVTTTFSSGREDVRQTPLGPVHAGPGSRPLLPIQPRR